MKFYSAVAFLFLLVSAVCTQTQAQQSSPKIVAECTITYSVNIIGNNKTEQTTKKLYIKGRKTRSEISNPSFYQATIFDNKTGEAVVLKEVGNDKYISQFNEEKWKEKNSRWNESSVKFTNETKNILSYNCRKAVITVKDSSHFIVYFTTDITASATENPYQFKNIPGLILEYESQTTEGKSIEFKAININFSPVPTAKFTIPVTGYRII